MKRPLLAYGLLLFTLLLTACNNNTIFDETRTFDRHIWNRFTPEVFNVEVNNIKDYYDIDVTVSVDTVVYRYDMMPLMINLYSASGEHRQFYSTIPLKVRDHWRGDMVDGYRQVDGRIRNYFSFNTEGKHRIEVSQHTSQYDLEGVHSVALSITKAKLSMEM